jgi:hypothetical protein
VAKLEPNGGGARIKEKIYLSYRKIPQTIFIMMMPAKYIDFNSSIPSMMQHA